MRNLLCLDLSVAEFFIFWCECGDVKEIRQRRDDEKHLIKVPNFDEPYGIK